MAAMIGRNLKVFFRDRASVFFSLLSVIIIIGLYALFLGDTMTSGMEDVEGIDYLMNSWLISGILAVISMTSTLGAYGVMVEDRARRINKDFAVSPLRRNAVAGGYVAGAFCVGVIMSMVALVAGEAYIYAAGGELLTMWELLQVIGGILLSVASSSAIVFLLVSFFKSQNGFAALSTILGTVIGFLIGMYVPIGSVDAGMQNVMKVFPVSYSASYFRNIMLERPMEIVFDGAPAQAAEDFKLDMGVNYEFDGGTTTLGVCILVMAATAVVFYVLGMMNYSRKRKAL